MAKQQAKRVNKDQQNADDESAQSGNMAVGSNPQGQAEDDHVYGLASVLYHALQGVTAARKYTEDARRAGAEELVEFFEECQREGAARAKQAKSLLLSYAEDAEDEDEDDEDEDDDE
jgi:hypothetical protein